MKKLALLSFLSLFTFSLFAQSKVEFSFLAGKYRMKNRSILLLENMNIQNRSWGIRFAYTLSPRFSLEFKGQFNKRKFLPEPSSLPCHCDVFGRVYTFDAYFEVYNRTISMDASIRMEIFRLRKLGFLPKVGIRGIQVLSSLGITQLSQLRSDEREYQDWSVYPAPGHPFQIGLVGDLGLRVQFLKRLFVDMRFNARWLLKESNYHIFRFQRGTELSLGIQI
ncbi:MAG: hypothetical protein AAFP19_19785 [Bacteroidota bacterium]